MNYTQCGSALALPYADGIAQMCVTSPPYYGLRAYLPTGHPSKAAELGTEQTPAAYVAQIVAAMREVWRVLRDDGTLWLNLGDSYASTAPGTRNAPQNYGNRSAPEQWANMRPPLSGNLKPKDLMGIPWAVAKALQQPFYTGRIERERDRVWLAAIIDAEGTICGFTSKRKDTGKTRTGVHVAITNSNRLILDEARRIWPASLSDHGRPGDGHLGLVPTWRWIAHNVDDKALLMRELYPYLIGKQKQCLLAWNFFELSKQAKRLAKTAEAQAVKDKRAQVMALLSELNHLRPVDIPGWCKEPPPCEEPGWYLRSDIVWAKPNPMPESVSDRTTKSHEYVFMLAKQPRYFYDAEAIAEPSGGANGSSFTSEYDRETKPGLGMGERKEASTRNARSVWTIATQPYSGAHFATMPPELARRCILAGSSARGQCPKCGAPWVRVTEKGLTAHDGETKSQYDKVSTAHRLAKLRQAARERGEEYANGKVTTGWEPSCDCEAGDPVPQIVLDPFAGSGTTAMVALQNGRRAIGTELNPAYLRLQDARTQVTMGLGL